MHVNPVIQATHPLPVVAPDVPVMRRPDTYERSQADQHNRRHDRDFAAASRSQHVGAAPTGRRDGDAARAMVEVDLRLHRAEPRAVPFGPSLTYLAQSLAQEVVPEHAYQQANARGAGINAYEAANGRIATVLGPVYPFERRV